MPEEPKVTYRTGASVAEIRDHNATIAATPPVVEPTPTIAPQATPPAATTPAVEPTPSIATPPPVSEPTPIPAATTEQEKNVATFKFDEFEEPTPTPSQATPQSEFNLDDFLGKVDKKEVLKKLGLSEFALEMDEHIKNGGQPIDYLNAKAVDYNKISDESLLKNDLRSQYPNLTPQQIDLLYNKRYEVDETAEDDIKQLAEINLQADAYKVRQAKIAEQQKFKIAETPAQVQNNNQSEYEALQQQEFQKIQKFYNEHPDTQTLVTSKRVAIDLGDDGKFNYNIDKPELLTRAILDGDFWRRITSVNPKEPDVTKLVPNVALQHKLGLIAMNPNYERDLVNYGKTLALPTVLAEGQNVKPPASVVPMTPENKGKVDWSAAKTGKVGG